MIPRLSTYLGKVSKNEQKSTEPPILYKRAGLMIDPVKQEIFVSPLTHARFGVALDAGSRCYAEKFTSVLHNSRPIKNCSCGFHAFLTEEKSEEYSKAGHYTLTIEASGRLLKYENGYRYGHQRVIAITADGCYQCGGQSTVLEASKLRTPGNEKQYLFPSCRKHLQSSYDDTYLTFSKFEEMISAQNLQSETAIKITGKSFSLF